MGSLPLCDRAGLWIPAVLAEPPVHSQNPSEGLLLSDTLKCLPRLEAGGEPRVVYVAFKQDTEVGRGRTRQGGNLLEDAL